MNPEILHILEPEEKILWNGKPDLKSLLTLAFIISAILLIVAFMLFFNMDAAASHKTTKLGDNPKQVINYIFIGFVGLSIIIPIAFYIFYKVTDYLVSDKRIIIKTGTIGADMRSIYYDQVRSAFVKVGLIGKIYNTGSILFDTGRITQSGKRGSKTVYDRFRNINLPYNVYKFVQMGLSSRKEGVNSGRADFESNNEAYKKFIQETEKMKKEVQ